MTKKANQFSLTTLPSGLWILSALGMIYCFGFSMINSLLVIFATDVLKYSTKEAYLLSASYNSLLFTVPLIGGYLSEKCGYQMSLSTGPVLSTASFLCLATLNKLFFFIGLGLFVAATSYFVPSLYVMIGKLFSKEDPSRESAYTLQYIIMNLGFFFGGLFGGYFHVWFGYQTTFSIGVFSSLIILPIFFTQKRQIKAHEGRIIGSQLGLSEAVNCGILMGVSALVVFGSYIILAHPSEYAKALIALVLTITVSIAIDAIKRKQDECKKLLGFIALSYFSIAFWTLYAMEPALLTVFIKHAVNKHLLGMNMPASSFYALDALFVILLGVLLSYLWLYLTRINLNPSLPAKFALSLLVMSLGFPVVTMGIKLTTPGGLVNPYYIVVAYALFALAELLISPIGIDMVERLSPEGMEGRLMGVWQLFMGFAGALAGQLSQIALIPKHTSAGNMLNVYSQAFLHIGAITLLVALLAWVLRPYLVRLVKSS